MLILVSVFLMFLSAMAIAKLVESKQYVWVGSMSVVYVIALLRVSAHIFGFDPR